MKQNTRAVELERLFNEKLVREYLRYGSVDEAIRRNRYNLPVSYANYQRILDKWAIIKAAGPNNKLAESVEFLSHLAKENVPFEELYRRMPPSFQTSAATLYRVLSYVKEGITRRVGAALIITPHDNLQKVLIAKDISVPRIELGKAFGDLTIPIGFAHKRDTRKAAITRVLQNEVFTDYTIKKQFPNFLLDNVPAPFMYLDIADVRVAVYHLQLTKALSSEKHFSSYKLKDFSFVNFHESIHESEDKHFRVGVKEAVRGYARYLNLLERKLTANPLQEQSFLNKELATVTVDIEI